MHVISAVWGLAGCLFVLEALAEGGGTPRRAGVIAGNVLMATVGEAAPTIRVLVGLLMVTLAVFAWSGVREALPALLLLSLAVLVVPGLAGVFDVLVLIAAVLLGTLPLLVDDGLRQVAGERGAR